MTDRPDLEIAGHARVGALRFRVKPVVRTGGAAFPAGAHDSGSDRENLPDRVEQGHVYCDASTKGWVRQWTHERRTKEEAL